MDRIFWRHFDRHYKTLLVPLKFYIIFWVVSSKFKTSIIVSFTDSKIIKELVEQHIFSFEGIILEIYFQK